MTNCNWEIIENNLTRLRIMNKQRGRDLLYKRSGFYMRKTNRRPHLIYNPTAHQLTQVENSWENEF